MSEEAAESGEDDILTCTVRDDDAQQRLDRVLAAAFPALSRSRLKALILAGKVTLDGAVVPDPAHKTKAGQELAVAVPPPEDAVPQPEAIPLSIVYEDDWLLVIDKQAGLVVHPGAGNPNGTLVNALLHHCGGSLSGIGGVRRPGIVHRLDKDTSGLMVAAKSDAAHQALSAQLADRTLGRHYHAVVWGVPRLPTGSVDQPIGRHPSSRVRMAVTRKNGREARTYYKVERRLASGAACLLDCRLESGRTHQVRVHMAHLGHPLVGDPLYGIQNSAALSLLRRAGCGEGAENAALSFPRQALHAWKIRFLHPRDGREMSFESPLPADIDGLINCLESME